jgi:hypothetical protein
MEGTELRNGTQGMENRMIGKHHFMVVISRILDSFQVISRSLCF